MHPEILLRIFANNGLHLLVHLFGDTKDLGLFALIFLRPDRIRYKTFILTVRFAAACYNHNRPVVVNG